MSKLKVPSLQHLSRMWRPNIERVRKDLIHLAQNSPTFSYTRLYDVVTDMIVLRQPYDEIEAGILKIAREDVRNNFLEILPLLRDYFDLVPDAYVQKVTTRFYPVARGLMIPFEPPLIYIHGGKVYLPWFVFWKENPLTQKQLSLFVTIIFEILKQDPDLEEATFEILDFSCPEKGAPRELRVTDATTIPLLTEAEKNEMLTIFAEGFIQAEMELAGRPPKKPAKEQEAYTPDPNQLALF